MAMHVYEALVKGLESVGVEAAFGGNGENIARLMLALKHSERITPVMTRHEQAASFMACGYAMYTNRIGVCFATIGPGAFNLLSGLGVALANSYPVLAISGYVSLDWVGRGATNETTGVRRTPDSQAMFAATTKKSYLITNIADTSDILDDAVNTALEGRPGPVHIHVPQNLARRGATVDNYHDVRLKVEPVLPNPPDVAAICAAIRDALNAGRRVVVLSGFGAIRSGAGAEMKKFVERFQIPLLTTLDGKGIISESHPLSVGVFSESGHSSAWKAFREADVVVAIGNSFSQHATFEYRDELFKDKLLIHVNISAMEISKAYRADYALVSDARLAVAAIFAGLDDIVGLVPKRRVDGQDWEARRIVHLSGSIHPGQLAQTMGKMLPPGGVILADAGAHLAWLGYYVELDEGQNFRTTGNFGPMSAHVNGAIGLKKASPHRTVVVGCGDGCYSMAGFELMTAVQNNIPVIWVIFNDNEYKLIKLYQLATFGESGLVEFQNPDFAAYARLCGGNGYRVETLDEFKEAFAAAIASGRPTVIDAKITRWAVPHYSPSPDGVIAGLVESIEARIHGD